MGEVAEYVSFIEYPDEPLSVAWDESDGLDHEAWAWVQQSIGAKSETKKNDLSWVNGQSMLSGKQVLLPLDLVLRRAGQQTGFLQANSTGVGAGETFEAAILSGLMEVIERDAIAMWWYGGRKAARFPMALVQEVAADAIAMRNADSVRKLWVLNLESLPGLPVVGAFSALEDGSSVVAGFSAGLSVAEAVKSALSELFQMELASAISLAKLDRGADDDVDRDPWLQRHRHLKQGDFEQFQPAPQSKLPSLTDVSLGLDGALGILSDNRFEPLVVDLTRQEVGIQVARVVVPHFQTAKPPPVTKRLRAAVKINQSPITDLIGAIAPI